MRVYYHCYLVNDWKSIVQEQIELLTDYGLYEACSHITLVAIGEHSDIRSLRKGLQKYDKIIIYPVSKRDHYRGERVTLSLLYEDCMSTKENYPVLYFHTKGITHMNTPTAAWRQLLGYYNLYLWKACVHALKSADTVGALYRIEPERRQYDGNFWWANSHFIKKLADPNDMPTDRQMDERWIGSLNLPYKAANLHTTEKDLYTECEEVSSLKFKGESEKCGLLHIDPLRMDIRVQELNFIRKTLHK